ncbi:MAG: ABC transporter ATP-binding protein [Candidatus Marinimicrobia bacterium]|nr:ABC transporter ATP-binding protein [Candidatus Neomarinimicrobiota bacterium]
MVTGQNRTKTLLEVNNLSVSYQRQNEFNFLKPRIIEAVRDVNLTVRKGETVGIVGQSGSGKTSFLMTILGFVKPTAGEILLQGETVSSPTRQALGLIRKHIQPVFQDPDGSLNPHKRIELAIADALPARIRRNKSICHEQVLQHLQLTGLGPEHLNHFPHQLSGGQKQRVCIARALAREPGLLLLDEPFSAQDLLVQFLLIELLAELKKRLRMTYLIIAHDLRMMRVLADRIAVMKNGKFVEINTVEKLFREPQHAYTKELLASGSGLKTNFHNSADEQPK